MCITTHACIKMEEIGNISVGRTQYLRKMYIYRCVRQPGLALEFISVNGTGDAYRCLQCTHLRKNRSLANINYATFIHSRCTK